MNSAAVEAASSASMSVAKHRQHRAGASIVAIGLVVMPDTSPTGPPPDLSGWDRRSSMSSCQAAYHHPSMFVDVSEANDQGRR